ncbi:unnamed protein product [Timema podura]|uniref:Uncharacterized protein n=1 Tax=Timema podura TaxID=61482 RepID=A0ABN7NNE6_TIMPD|nr:unnamed protein product [Timema podura]
MALLAAHWIGTERIGNFAQGTVPRYLFDDCQKDIMWEIDESGTVRHSPCICNAPSCTSRKIPTPPNRRGRVTKIQPRLKRLLPKNWGKRSKKWKEDQVVARRRSAHKKYTRTGPNPDIPVFSSLVYCGGSASNHEATEADYFYLSTTLAPDVDTSVELDNCTMGDSWILKREGKKMGICDCSLSKDNSTKVVCVSDFRGNPLFITKSNRNLYTFKKWKKPKWNKTTTFQPKFDLDPDE